jgi:hypothetical protein
MIRWIWPVREIPLATPVVVVTSYRATRFHLGFERKNPVVSSRPGWYHHDSTSGPSQ